MLDNNPDTMGSHCDGDDNNHDMAQASATTLETPGNAPHDVDLIHICEELPSVAIRANRMLANANVSAVELANVISLDLGLSDKILRLCNSSAYALPRKIASVKEAITILGLKELRQIMMTIISRSVLTRAFPGYGLNSKALWKNALAAATCAKSLSQTLGHPDKELAFTAAMLRDIGKLVIDPQLEPHIEAVQLVAIRENKNFHDAEHTVLGNNHCRLGQALAEKWAMPQAISLCIGYHHAPSEMPISLDPALQRLVGIVHLADSFTSLLGIGLGRDGLLYRIDTRALTVLGLGEADVIRFYQDIIQQEDAPHKAFDNWEAIL